MHKKQFSDFWGKDLYLLFMFLCCVCGIFSVGCGKKEEGLQQEGVVEYKDVQTESGDIFNREGTIGKSVGLQFYEGEPVQIWAVRNDGTADICLYREDGSREVLLEGMPEDYYFADWFMDAEGCFYRWSGIGILVKMDSSGKELYSVPLDDIGADRVEGLCQLADGRVFFTYMEGIGSSHYGLAEVASGTGKTSRVSTAKLDGFGCIAAGETGLLYMDAKGVYEIDMEDGSKTSILSFLNTSYQLKDTGDIRDFRMLEDGSVEILRQSRDYDTEDVAYTSEVLQAGTETTEKAVLTMRCYGFSKYTGGVEGWLKNQMAAFNRQSSSYVVVLDENQEGAEREDFARQTSIEIAAGKGPDIIFGEVLGGDSVPDAEALADALLAWEGDAVFQLYRDSQWVLRYLLQGSADFWGMVDWEAGTCDFSGAPFAKMLEAAKRYGYDERNNYPEVAEYRELVEDARPLPIRTAPLLDIICEEAEYYFDGSKSIEEVSAIIRNRVQLYMDENS